MWAVLDPRILFLPTSADPTVVEASVSSLVDWQGLLREGWPTSFISASGLSALADLSGYPLWQSIRTSIEDSGLEVDVHDVIEVYNGLLKLPAIEDELQIVDLLYADVNLQPKVYSDPEQRLVEEFERACMLLSCLKYTNVLDDRQLLLFTNRVAAEPTDFLLEGVVDFVEPAINTTSEIPCGQALTCRFKGLSRYDRVLDCCDPLLLWEQAESNLDLRRAILAALPEEARTVSWSLGDRFYEAIDTKHLRTPTQASPIIRACCECIQHLNTRDTHALRDGAKQQRRDSDTAWRRDVTRNLHLHYWETGAGPELSWVTVTHDDFYISQI